MIALIIAALLAHSAGIAAPLAGAVNARLVATRAGATVGRTTEPDGGARTLFLHTLAPSTGRVHAPSTSGGDGARSTVALGVERASLDLASPRAPGAAVDAREHGVSSPGQPAPSSRAPPLG